MDNTSMGGASRELSIASLRSNIFAVVASFARSHSPKTKLAAAQNCTTAGWHHTSRVIRNCGTSLGLDEPRANRESNQTRNLVDVELLHQVRSMRIDGLERDTEHARDLFARQTLGDQLQNFSFPIRQHRNTGWRRITWARDRIDDLLSNRRGEI